MTANSDSWGPPTLDSSILRQPDSYTPAPVVGKLELLPLDLLSWEDFERIQWRIMRDVQGLRSAQIYGKRGQRQHGLDIVALEPNQIGVALQSKRYLRFGPSELKAAVTKFRAGGYPFSVGRFIVGVSRIVKSTQAIETLASLRAELQPTSLELWDQQELSRLVRNAPEIVIEFFGMETAKAFCLPFKLEAVLVPPSNAVAIREALARTPEVATGADTLFAQADVIEADPSRALALVEAGQEKLRGAGFAAHAAQYDERRSRLLVSLGRANEAGRRIIDQLWTALDQGQSHMAQQCASRVQQILQSVPDDEEIGALAAVARAAIDLYSNPLAFVPEPDSLAIGEATDQVRLAVLAGETALANDNWDWLKRAEAHFIGLSASTDTDLVQRTRLRILIAESSADWTALLDDARKLKLGHGLLGLVSARYARQCALNQKFEEAEALWDEAAGDACLAQCWTEASTWTFSRRAFRGRWRPFASDEILPIESALRDMGPSRSIVSIDESAHEEALDDLRTQRLRPAAISAQRALRDAVVTSNWARENQVRRALAGILVDSDELELAAQHLAQAGDTEGIRALGVANPRYFIDITNSLTAPNYWTVGTAYRLIAEQADLVPDNIVSRIADLTLAELAGAEAGTLPDIRSFAVSRYQGAVSALAGIAQRLTEQQADTALSHFERQPSVDANHYRYHDEGEATAVAGIAVSQLALRDRALAHLVPLLARSQAARNATTESAIADLFQEARPYLEDQAASGDDWAREALSARDASATPPALGEAALLRLTTPLEHQPGVYTVGTGAVGDSVLVLGLPARRLGRAVTELLRRANDAEVASSDRGEYMIAAGNLATRLTDAQRISHFRRAMRLVTSPTPSRHDDMEAQFNHKLGGFRIVQPLPDSRDKAVYLAACFAVEAGQRQEVKNHLYGLLGAGDPSDYWLTRAMQRLGDTLNEDLGFLIGHGWAIRSLACSLWVKVGVPAYVGMRLARDDDVRVRRALARALAALGDHRDHSDVRDELAHDPAFSVRTALDAK